MHRITCCCFALFMSLMSSGCDSTSHVVQVEGMEFFPPASWIKEQPPTAARVAQYALPGTSANEDAGFVVFYFGDGHGGGAGSVEANLQRWVGQIEQPDGSPSSNVANIYSQEINGLEVVRLDVSGTYVAETFPGSGQRVNNPNFRLLAAIVTTDAGPYFFKIVGPATTVSKWLDDYETMMAGLQPSSAE